MGGEKQNSLCLILLLCFITGTSADMCFQPKQPGPCKAYIPSWFYNPSSSQCEEFIYGGCGGNDNRFSTLEECKTTCIAANKCFLPNDPGPCDANFPKWFYNRISYQCEEFIYGGCGGNENRFSTKEECQTTCIACGPECEMYCPYGKVMDSQGCPLCECNLCGPVCDMYCPYGNVMDSQGCPLCECNQCGPVCDMYCQYGNVMDSQGCPLCECNPCGPVCQMYCPYGNVMDSQGCPLCECNPANPCFLPKKPGTCTGYFPMWFYNPSSNQCEEFIYGGCDGNDNSFSKLEDCRTTCTVPVVGPPPCPKDSLAGPLCNGLCQYGYTCNEGRCCSNQCPKGRLQGPFCDVEQPCKPGYECMNGVCCRLEIIVGCDPVMCDSEPICQPPGTRAVIRDGECCPTCPDDCTRVDCLEPLSCYYTYRPPGTCCDVCDCSTVLCLAPDCSNSYTPAGECCPVCPNTGCDPDMCDSEPYCQPSGTAAVIRDGECCPTCPDDCTVVKCDKPPSCSFTYRPPGTCCDACDCSMVSCLALYCSNSYRPAGECCPVCPNTGPDVPGPDCGDVCTLACEYGNVLDSHGCPTCACNPAHYPPKLGADSNNGCRKIDLSINCIQYLEQCKSDTACQGRMGGCAKCCKVECGTQCQRTDHYAP